MTARGLIIAAPNSGAGKTTITLGLLAALKRKGIVVKAAKAGPDYIDPAFHAAATGTQGFNLDTWAMPPPLVDALVAESVRDCQLLVIEGVMGLFDGVPGPTGRNGATADLAARLACRSFWCLMSRARRNPPRPWCLDFARYRDPTSSLRASILNQRRQRAPPQPGTDAIAQLGVRVVGALPREERIVLPERHLGLVQASEHGDLRGAYERWRTWPNGTSISTPSLPARVPLEFAASGPISALPPPGQRIALAPRRGIHLCLSASARILAQSGCGDRGVFAARRRAAARDLRRLLATGRLSGTACRHARCCAEISGRYSRASHRRGRCTASAAATWSSARA